MKKLTLSVFALLVIIFGAIGQNLEPGTSMGPDPVIIDAPENIRWLHKQADRSPFSGVKSVYFYEGFETPTEGGALPEGWVQKRTATPADDPVEDAESPRWFRNSASYGFPGYEDYVYSGVASMAIGYTAPDFTWAISPEFHIPESDGDVFLTYWAWINNALPAGFDEPILTNYFIKVKMDDEWFTLFSYFGVDGESNFFDEQLSHSMNVFKGKDVQIAFVYEYFGWQMAVDDVLVAEILYDDFGVSTLSAFPTFGLLPGHHVDISASVFCNGLNPGTVEVSLLVNGEVVDTHTTGELEQGGDSEFVTFAWEAPAPGYYDIQVVLPDDDFIGNNSVSETVYVNHYYNMAEHFENFEFDDLGIPELVFPPHGWTVNDPLWVGATLQWPIFDEVSAAISGRAEEDEKILVTKTIDLTPQDHWIRFFLEGVNNAVEVTPGEPEGHSTFQLKYSTSPGGPWTDLGDPIEFVNTFDDDDNLIVTANGLRHVEHDISHLSGTHYFAFTTTSNFDFIQNDIVYRSWVMVDNVMIGSDPVELPDVTFHVTYDDESPAADATIRVYDEAEALYATLTTGADGMVVAGMEAGDYTYVATKPGYRAEGDFTVGEEDMTVEIVIEEVPTMLTLIVDMTDAVAHGDVEFNPDIHGVFVAGSFSDPIWQQPGSNPDLELHPVTSKAGHFYTITLAVEPGDHEYKYFLVEDDPTWDIGEWAEEINREITVVEDMTVEDVFGVLDDEDDTSLTETVDAKLNVYPNPASNHVMITADDRIDQIELFAVTGQRVMAKAAGTYSLAIDLSGLKNGLYIIRVHTEKGIITERLQVNILH